jgi:hypothetical protein
MFLTPLNTHCVFSSRNALSFTFLFFYVEIRSMKPLKVFLLGNFIISSGGKDIMKLRGDEEEHATGSVHNISFYSHLGFDRLDCLLASK